MASEADESVLPPVDGERGPDDDLAAPEHEEHEPDGDGHAADTADDDQSSSGWAAVDWYACAALVALALLLVGLHVHAYPTLSPVDELQHVDYVVKAGNFDVPRQNERLGFEAMSEASCRLIDAPEYLPPACGLDDYDPQDFPERGFNTSASQLPPYYSITGVTSRLIDAASPLDSQVTSARLVGGLWLGGGLALIWYVLALFGTPRVTRAVVLALLAATPLVLFHSATVNADALLLLTGALVLLTTLKFEQGRLAWWWLLAIYVGVILVEPTNLLATSVGAAYLGIRLTPRAEETPTRRTIPFAALMLTVMARVDFADRLRGWLYPAVPKPAGSGPRPSNVARAVDEVSLDRVLSQLPSVFTPVSNTYLPPPLRTAFTINLIQLTNWLLIGLLFAVAFVYVAKPRTSLLARLGLVAMLLAGPTYTFYYAYFSDVDFPAPGRFGLPLLPIVVVAAAGAVRSRSAFVVTTAVSAVVVANTAYLLVAA